MSLRALRFNWAENVSFALNVAYLRDWNVTVPGTTGK